MVTLEQIKELREKTGVSTMTCKKALEESGGDMEAAIQTLRKKGEVKAAERSDRSTGEGGIFAKNESGKAAIIALGSETDFVARSDDFKKYGQELADALFEGNIDTAKKKLSDVGIKLGEKIEFKGEAVIEGTVTGTYIHSNGKIGVAVALSGGTEEQARDVAMHIAAIAPKCINPEDIDSALIKKEKEIWSDQLKQEGKSEEMLNKIMMGKEKKFRSEHALMSQAFVKDPQKTIAEYLGDVKVEQFKRFSI